MSANHPIPVTGMNGLRGTLDPATWDSPESSVVIHLQDGGAVSVPRDLLVEQPDGGYYLPLARDQFESAQSELGQAGRVIPIIEEQAHISRSEEERGKVRVVKHVREWEEQIDEPRIQETVEVERVSIQQMIDRPAQVRQEGDTLIIPVMEEVLVVEKRILLKEEVRVTRRREETRENQRVTLRKEEIQVERTESPDRKDRD